MKMRTKIYIKLVNKYKWLLVGIVVFPIVLSIIVSLIWPFWAVAGDTNTWIGFWGAYAGAIGTVLMAVIALDALKTNEEQLDILKQQNRPYLFSSISILHEWDYNNQCNKDTFILRIENHGSQIAKHVKIKIGVSDLLLLKEPILMRNIEAIENSCFSLPAKGEKYFIIGEALPIPPQEKTKEEVRKFHEQWNLIDKIKESVFTITLKCDDYEDETESIALNSVGYMPTTTVQILDYINHNLKELLKHINNIKDDKT